MTAGDPIATGLADRYRRALADGVPEAEDDRRYGFGLAAACISWAIVHLHRFACLDNRAPGDGSRLQLVESWRRQPTLRISTPPSPTSPPRSVAAPANYIGAGPMRTWTSLTRQLSAVHGATLTD
ncbi:hypothetical protein [Actinacidiphila soli]|uniref:hypothetical protein n=1 Tax=Actinacidiphila soli TaxID=2487275 RepID=UPI001F0BE0E4|nr:hypothetical protein [Actinacidiphila soli]